MLEPELVKKEMCHLQSHFRVSSTDILTGYCTYPLIGQARLRRSPPARDGFRHQVRARLDVLPVSIPRNVIGGFV